MQNSPMKHTPSILDAPNSKPGLKNWMTRLIKGLLVGIGAILPGLSGGVLSVIFGIYDPMIRFLAHITHQFKENVRYFIPVGIGGVLGVLLFSVFVEKAFGRFEAQFVCLFIGFVIGTFPSLYRTAGKEGRHASDLWILAIFAILLFAIMFMGRNFPAIQPSPLVWFFAGALDALGFIVPGMSPSNFLIYFSLYDKMASSISHFDFTMLIPFGLGAVLCIFAFAKLVARMFQQHYSKMYHAILGLVIGSTIAIFPSTVFPAFTPAGLQAMGLGLPVALPFALIMLALGIFLSYRFSLVEERIEREHPRA